MTLAIVDDELDEPDEALTVILEPLPSTQAVVALRQPDGSACPGTGVRCDATVTIVDNDASEDATLSGLAVNDGSTDLLTFAPGTTTYTAMVASDVETLTFTATKGDDGASVAYLDSDGNPIDDADTAAGHQVPLDVGANVITVRVTAQDGTTTETYTVTVNRAALAVSAVFGAARYDVTEGESVTVTVNLSEAPGRELTLPLNRENAGGVNDADLTGVPPSVTFAATAMSASFTVMATDNDVYNGGSSRWVLLEPLPRPDGVFEAMTGATTTQVYILDNEDPPPTVDGGGGGRRRDGDGGDGRGVHAVAHRGDDGRAVGGGGRERDRGGVEGCERVAVVGDLRRGCGHVHARAGDRRRRHGQRRRDGDGGRWARARATRWATRARRRWR